MSPEELDEARAREAFIIGYGPGYGVEFDKILEHVRAALLAAARLAREGWEPTDPDLIEAREVVAAVVYRPSKEEVAAIKRGSWDEGVPVRAALAAIKRGRELERVQP